MGTEAGCKSRFMAPGPAPPNVGLEKTPTGSAALVCSAPEPFNTRGVQDSAMTVLVYVNTNKQVGDAEHIKAFANSDAAETWFAENDPEGVAFEYEVLEWDSDAHSGLGDFDDRD